MDTDDKVLVARCREGDHDAFRRLVQKYERRIYGIVVGMIRDREEAWDLTQEVFVKVYRHLDTFEGNSSLYTWMYRIAVNLSIDHIRKRRIPGVEYDDSRRHVEPVDLEAPLGTRSESPPQRLLREELVGKVNRALERLSTKHKQIIILREVEGLSYQEIADVLGISIGTVMSRLFHARRNMQVVLEKYLEKGV
ncbi:MAG: sigma-70 family RNA polymerase sigma factor [Deltaproteobacteria bacterium]|nr:sigma-70 family RNA polymerase sigma factor [Deltaproteobacteria bacterium]